MNSAFQLHTSQSRIGPGVARLGGEKRRQKANTLQHGKFGVERKCFASKHCGTERQPLQRANFGGRCLEPPDQALMLAVLWAEGGAGQPAEVPASLSSQFPSSFPCSSSFTGNYGQLCCCPVMQFHSQFILMTKQECFWCYTVPEEIIAAYLSRCSFFRRDNAPLLRAVQFSTSLWQCCFYTSLYRRSTNMPPSVQECVLLWRWLGVRRAKSLILCNLEGKIVSVQIKIIHNMNKW